MWKPRTKWGVARKTKWGGQQYDSQFEASYAQELNLLKKGKKIKDWEAHKTIPLIVNGYHIGSYKIDFVVRHLDGTEEYIEVKGFADAVWRLKWKIFCATHEDEPNKKITLIWQGKNYPKLRKIKKLKIEI